MRAGKGLLRFKPSLLVLLVVSALLAGCATLTDPERSQENKHDVIAPDLHPGEVVGQSFRMPNPGLNGVTVWVKREAPPGSPASPLQVRLFTGTRAALEEAQPVYEATISVTASGPLYLAFSPRREPSGQEYFLALNPGDPAVRLLGSEVDVYPEGQAYAAGQSLAGDLAFQVTYRYGWASLAADLTRFARLLGPLLAAALLLVLPGWLVLDLTGLRPRLGGSEQAALATGLSLALLPLLLLWTSTLGLRWTPAAVWIALGLLVGMSIWRIWRGRFRLTFSWTGLALAAVLLFGLGLRLAMVRDLAAPAWVDSVHHSLITRLILEEGRFPQTYEPYLDLPPTRYHAGFHAGLAGFLALTGLPITGGILLYGQVLNAMASLAAYLMGVTLSGDRRTGLVAAGITAVFTPMPAYYASWGRYPHLAGLLILPAALALLRLVLDGRLGERPEVGLAGAALPEAGFPEADGPDACRPEVSGPIGNAGQENTPPQTAAAGLVLAALSLGGLLLVHYRAAAFTGLLLAAYLASRIPLVRTGMRPWLRQAGLALAVIASGGLLVTLPWVLPNLGRLWTILTSPSSGGAVQAQLFADFSWRLLTTGLGYYTLGLAGAGLVWALITGRRFALTLVLWVAGMFFLANLGPLSLPGAWFVNNTSVAITLFLPIAVLGGFITTQVFFELPFPLTRSWRAGYASALTLLGGLLLVYGAPRLLPILNPATFLYRSADLPAIGWVAEHVPQGETILINPFQWGYGVCAGSDGGYWISPLAGRKTIPPPVIYGFGSTGGRTQARRVCTQVQKIGADPEALWSFLKEEGIRYVFTGVKGGPISPAALASSPRFETLFQEGGAWVFRTASKP